MARRGERGFTLIEMMVALAVFSLAALALIRLEGATIRSAATLDRTVIGQIVARNVAVEAMTDARVPPSGSTTGIERNAGREWTWQRVTTPLGDQGVVRIDVSVSDNAGNVVGRLTMIRPPAPPTATGVTPA